MARSLLPTNYTTNMVFRRKTCQNAILNLKYHHYAHIRPILHPLSQSFCTSSELSTSYSDWLTSREVPSKIFSRLVELQDDSSPQAALQVPSHSLRLPLLESGEEQVKETLVIDTKHLLQLAQESNFKAVAERLGEYRSQWKYIPIESLNEIISECSKQIPFDLDNINGLEKPRFKGLEDLLTPFAYRQLYKNIPYLHQISKWYETRGSGNVQFQENYIWLCYHMDDVDTLQRLVYPYLKTSIYNSRCLSYLMTSFIINYDIEFSKSLFCNVIAMLKPLNASLLQSVIHQMIKNDAIFENITTVFHSWILSANCESPSPEIYSMVLNEYYKHGTEDEIQEIRKLTSKFDKHYLIESSHLQHEIINRTPYSLKKVITSNDIIRINELAASLANHKKQLADFYFIFLKFFARYSNMKMIQYIILKMKQDDIVFYKKYFDVLITYYSKNEKFLTLLKLLMKSSVIHSTANGIEYSHIYVKQLFDTFVQTYPYEAPEFNQKFEEWLNQHSRLSSRSKEKLLANCRIVKLKSQLTPYNIKDSKLSNVKKYDRSEWKELDTGSACKPQVDFRVNKGFRDVMRKGLKPDYELLESTFKRLHANYRSMILGLTSTLRLSRYNVKLNLLNLQLSNSPASELRDFWNQKYDKLNANNEIKLARMLMNKHLYDETNQVLLSIPKTEMSDKKYMIKLNIQLRNEMNFNRFDKMNQIIESFPINTTVLSPYIYNQCRYIEHSLVRKLELQSIEADENHNCIEHQHISEGNPGPLVREEVEATLAKLRGLIGDIQLRLNQDKHDLNSKVSEMFEFLNQWIDVKLRNTGDKLL